MGCLPDCDADGLPLGESLSLGRREGVDGAVAAAVAEVAEVAEASFISTSDRLNGLDRRMCSFCFLARQRGKLNFSPLAISARS